MPNDLNDSAQINAVLGPTNTGKTHYALSRMLGHASGIMGFPLRLLARENYDRAVAQKGADQVALITGEEKIVPKDARWYLCTVESMPLEKDVAFIGLDEVQMCADPDRGHVFTDRLLNARGRSETMFLGAETIRPLINELVPDADIVTRPRFSVLTHVGPMKVSRLPNRSAIVTFTASDVYALAELIRRQRGGAAVVLGALSPRTRNAQVGMYQAGEVDYLVATDAIGMGLNMDIDHVAFATLKKFDGRIVRPLGPAELAQAAGRAGRHMNDGTFGTTAEAGVLDEDIAERIEEHRFDPLQHIFWRNNDLDLRSIDALRSSLKLRPPEGGLKKARIADDEIILDRLRQDEKVLSTATTVDQVGLLWDVCQIPDFRGVMSDAHANLALSIYHHLTSKDQCLPVDWMSNHVNRLDRVDGDIDTLIGRIAGVRTWTYVSFRSDWVADSLHWQERTRTIEDKLSDALHERLTQRFVDRKTSVLVSKLKDSADLQVAVRAEGEVLIEGEHIGQLHGLTFTFEDAIEGDAGRSVANAAIRALRTEVIRVAQRIHNAPDSAFTVESNNGKQLPRVLWEGVPIARFTKGTHALSPALHVIADDILEPRERDVVLARLDKWLRGQIEKVLSGLQDLDDASLKGAARGLAFQLKEGLGSLWRGDAAAQIDALSREDRKHLRKLGVRLGRDMAFLPAVLKPNGIKWRALLWALSHDRNSLPEIPDTGRVSIPITQNTNRAFIEACGYRVLGPLAIRIDMAERLTSKAWMMAKNGPFEATAELTSMIGASNEQLPTVLKALGFKRIQRNAKVKNEEGIEESVKVDKYIPIRAGKKKDQENHKRGKTKNTSPKVDPDSPFAKLQELTLRD
jgi:ATP-dependent RNA helicase SUPV3L1/SUV3